ncbi:MAG: M4 family metallopeptidase [Bacteroidota bacterium]
MRSERAALGLGASDEFAPLKIRARGSRHYVRLGQTHGGIPVFAAEATVQLDGAGRVVFVLPDLARSPDLDRLGTTPRLTSDQAAAAAMSWARGQRPGIAFETRPASLAIFAPEVLGLSGTPRLVWDLEVGPVQGAPTGAPAPGAAPGLAHRLLLDAGDGTVVRAYPLSKSALDRDVYDSQVSTQKYKVLARREGWPATGIADVDQSYDFLGDVYNFYAVHFGRDGIDGLGMSTKSDVRYCDGACPYDNAFWDSWYGATFFGAGWAEDDVTAHEFTHGVTDYTSGLIYENASGAMNESFSDMFGEFVDLTNGRGNDTPSARWLCGEDLAYGVLRDMRNPPAFGDPDRLGSPLYIPPVSNPNNSNDQGGVHTNSGVSNKLCSLLVDGGAFNGETVAAMGIDRVADLMYETDAYVLTSSPGWNELYVALCQASVNLGWNAADRENVRRACAAVEISILWVDQAAGCIFPNGESSCGLYGGPYPTVGGGVAGALPGTRIHIRTGNYPEALLLNQNGRFEAEYGAVRIGP